MKITTLILGLLTLSVSVSKAAFISFVTGGARGHQFVLNDATTRVTTGTIVRVGYLTTPGNSGTFVEFATTSVANPLSTQPIGGFVNTKTGDNPAVAGIRNQQVVIHITGQNGNQGMWTSAAWTVPNSLLSDTDASFDVNLGVAQGNTPIEVTALQIEGFKDVGYVAPVTITVGTSSNTSGASYILGVAVPEPSTTVLGAVLGLGLMMRRRRA